MARKKRLTYQQVQAQTSHPMTKEPKVTPNPIPDETAYFDIWEEIQRATEAFYPKIQKPVEPTEAFSPHTKVSDA